MSKRDALGLLACLLLGLGIAVVSVRLARHDRDARVELGRNKLTELDARTRSALAALDDEVFLTYYVSDRSRMPSHMRRVEGQVTDLLEAFEEAGRGLVRYQIVDPESDPELARYAAGQRAAPFRVRTVTRDAYTERSVWSTLTVAYGPHAPAVINGVVPEYLPRLQGIVVEHLNQMLRPRPPVIALCAPPEATVANQIGARGGWSGLRRVLERRGEVVDVDLEAGETLPERADLLFWMEPGEVGPAQLEQLARFLETGRSVVLAGGAWDSAIEARDGRPAVRFTRRAYGMETLLEPLGLTPVPGLVVDARHGHLQLAEENVPLPFVVHSIAPQQDFRTLLGQPNGTLVFALPTPFTLDPDGLAEGGWTPLVLASTSDATRIRPLADESGSGAEPGATTDWMPLDGMTSDLRPVGGEAAPRQALAVLLQPSDPWRGSVVACSSSSPFLDGFFTIEGMAHAPLVDVLLDNLVSDERLVIRRAHLDRAAPLPPLGLAGRVLWRAACVLLLPGAFVALALVRGRRGSGGPAGRRAAAPRRWRASMRGPLLGGGVVLLLALAGVRLLEGLGLRADWTAEDLNRLAPRTAELARASTGDAALRAELVFSPSDRLPPALRPHVGRLEGLLDELERAGADLTVVRVHPEDLDEAEREALAAEGIEPVRSVTRGEGEVTVRKVYGHLRLSARGRTELLALTDTAAFEGLEFRVAFALWRLQTGRRPHVAFASDIPRLAPAVAHEEYQNLGLFAPRKADPYTLAREELVLQGWRVSHVNPRDPVLPEDVDLLVWIQPRRTIDEMLDLTVDSLHRGGSVLIAAQHFNIRPQQHKGAEFAVVHWPEPQSPDLDSTWFPEIGIHLVRDVLLDELMTQLEQETEVNEGGAEKVWRKQSDALPFLVRAVAANFDPDSPITRGLGDQAFLWPSRITWDDARLAELGIEAHPLITSSERSWVYDWEGGFLPEAVLAGPGSIGTGPAGAGAQDGEDELTWAGPQTLVALFEGPFPRMWNRPPLEDAAPGRLLLVGGSEMFKNHRLREPEFRADHLLVDAVAALTLEEGLAEVATRRPVARGFDWVEPSDRLRWRGLVLGAMPLLLAAGGLLRAMVRKRPIHGLGHVLGRGEAAA